MKKPAVVIIASFVLALLAYAIAPDSIPELGRRTIAIFVVAAVLWSTEAIPLYATSLCVVGLEVLLLAEKGGLAGQGGLAYHDFLKPFSSGVIILFMGGLMLSKAMSKTRVDEIIAHRFLVPFAKSPLRLIFGVMIITAFLSMWISNTATAAMMLAIISPVLRPIPQGERFRLALILAVPFGANIGGIGTPVGSPPNAIALAALRGAGLEISFLNWMATAVPLMVILIGLTGGFLYRSYRPSGKLNFTGSNESIPTLDRSGMRVLGVLCLSVFLWTTSGWHGINEGVIALLAAAFLTAFRILDGKDVNSIHWNILILMWGGLSLSEAVTGTGLSAWLGGLSMAQFSGFWVHAAFVLLAAGLSTFMSNTAAASLIIPLALLLPSVNPVYVVLLVAFACSFAMALPISTPPNAIAFSSGGITAGQMVKTGGIISAVGVALLLLGCEIVLPIIFP